MTSSAFALDPAVILRDLVVVNGATMSIEDVRICTQKANPQVTKQVSVKAEAPSYGVISRDRFVAIYAALLGKLLTEYDCKPVASLIGEADMSLKIVMATDGIQFRADDNGKVERYTKLWKDL
jgi:hypothetical protein